MILRRAGKIFLPLVILATLAILITFSSKLAEKVSSDCSPGLSGASGTGGSNFSKDFPGHTATAGKIIYAFPYCFNYSQPISAYFNDLIVSDYEKIDNFGKEILSFTVPSNLADGIYTFKVKNGDTFTQSFQIRVFLEPVISSISPSSVSGTTVVTLEGNNFGNYGDVPFYYYCFEAGSETPQIISWSNREIKFKFLAEYISKYYSSKNGLCKNLYGYVNAGNYLPIEVVHLYSPGDPLGEWSSGTQPANLYLVYPGATVGAKASVPAAGATELQSPELPLIFYRKGSATTDLSKVSLKEINNFTLDIPEKNKIEFIDVVDLSNNKDKIFRFDNYVLINSVGRVEVKSNEILALKNKRAKITMRNLPFLSTPRILVDGVEDNKLIAEIKYDTKMKTLIFNTSHFTTFLTTPSIKITKPTNKFTTWTKKINVEGEVNDPTATIQFKLNDRNIGIATASASTGKFSKQIELKDKINIVSVEAIATNSATAAAKISGTYKKLPWSGILIATLLVVGSFLGAGLYVKGKLKRQRSTEK